MTKFDALTRRIEDILAAIAIERAGKRRTYGLETMLRKARTDRMRLGLKITRKQGAKAA
jgi:hypothetical protein